LRTSPDSSVAAALASGVVRAPEIPERSQPDAPELTELRLAVRDDLTGVDAEIRQQLHSDVALVDQVSHYIVNSGGKRLRPMLVLLAARACGYVGTDHLRAAAIIEFIHTATLLHDDVVDASSLRRGRLTANNVWGNQASVLVGDFLYSRAFQMMVSIGSMRVMSVLADATNTIAEGEVQQLINCRDPQTTEERYLQVIRRKTAKLFEAGAQISAIISGQTPAVEEALATYGHKIGMAFQLRDDLLDYGAPSAEIGKNIGDDLAEGKPTLPLIHAMRAGSAEQARVIRTAIEHGGRDRMNEVVAAIESTGALDYTAQLARREAAAALAALDEIPDSPYRRALVTLAHIAAERTY
jgi:octaprenyl-diphosphate synthase